MHGILTYLCSAYRKQSIIDRECLPAVRHEGIFKAPVTSCGTGAGSDAAGAAVEAAGGPALALAADSALGVPGGSGGRGWDA